MFFLTLLKKQHDFIGLIKVIRFQIHNKVDMLEFK